MEINGDEGCTIYILHFSGGPCDGQVINGFRPYHAMKMDGAVYKVNDENNFLEWVDDWTRKIVLLYDGDSK